MMSSGIVLLLPPDGVLVRHSRLTPSPEGGHSQPFKVLARLSGDPLEKSPPQSRRLFYASESGEAKMEIPIQSGAGAEPRPSFGLRMGKAHGDGPGYLAEPRNHSQNDGPGKGIRPSDRFSAPCELNVHYC